MEAPVQNDSMDVEQHDENGTHMESSNGGTGSPTVAALQRMLGPSGGVSDERHLPMLESLMEQPQGAGMQTVLLLVLEQSTSEIKAQALKGKALKCVEGWVNEAVEAAAAAAPPQDVAALLQAVLRCLASLPMDLPTLRRTGIGRVVGSLRKQADAAVASLAKQLVEQWRRLQADSAGAAADGSQVLQDRKR